MRVAIVIAIILACVVADADRSESWAARVLAHPDAANLRGAVDRIFEVSFSSHARAFPSKAPAQSIAAHRAEQGSYPHRATVELAIDSTSIVLDVTRNDRLFSPQYAEYDIDAEGKARKSAPSSWQNAPQNHCFYVGRVASWTESPALRTKSGKRSVIAETLRAMHGSVAGQSVAVSLCGGITGRVGGLYVEKIGSSLVAFRLEDVKRRGTCGSTESAHDIAAASLTGHVSAKMAKGDEKYVNYAAPSTTGKTGASTPMKPMLTGNKQKYVEMALMSDKRQVDIKKDQTATYAAQIANLVQSTYRNGKNANWAYDIEVVLFAQYLFSQGDPYSAPNMSGGEASATNLLDKFYNWRSNAMSTGSIQVHDNGQLLTGYDLNGGTIGIAGVGSMCQQTRSGGVNQAFGFTVAEVAATLAHEMGHNFAMDHNEEDFLDGTNCASSTEYIMDAFAAVTPPTQWSQCSRKWLSYYFEGYGAFSRLYSTLTRPACLENPPSQQWSSGNPVCGDGVREGDEECDCGASCATTDPCCDGSTCKLKSTARCSAADPCCDSTCNYRAASYVCRAQQGSCDTEEKCTGVSGACPSDNFVPAGSSCTDTLGGAGTCYRGSCVSYNAQCKHLRDTVSSYASLLKNQACQQSSEMCGRLFCRRQSDNACLVGFTEGDGTAMADDGSPCGTNQQCLANTCVGSWSGSDVSCTCRDMLGNTVANSQCPNDDSVCARSASTAPGGEPDDGSDAGKMVLGGIFGGIAVVLLAVFVRWVRERNSSSIPRRARARSRAESIPMATRRSVNIGTTVAPLATVASRWPPQQHAVPLASAPSLPPHWSTHTDASGNVYYYNDLTGVSQWEVPHAI